MDLNMHAIHITCSFCPIAFAGVLSLFLERGSKATRIQSEPNKTIKWLYNPITISAYTWRKQIPRWWQLKCSFFNVHPVFSGEMIQFDEHIFQMGFNSCPIATGIWCPKNAHAGACAMCVIESKGRFKGRLLFVPPNDRTTHITGRMGSTEGKCIIFLLLYKCTLLFYYIYTPYWSWSINSQY